MVLGRIMDKQNKCSKARKMKFSIIVPVYNRSKTIEECLDSVLAQTFQDFEVICIDDGSEDDSLQKLELYASKDRRVRILHQSNQGVSAARNAGLKYSIGEYILFVDSDDWLRKDALEQINQHLGFCENVDILLFTYKWCSFEKEGRSELLNNCVDKLGEKPFSVPSNLEQLVYSFGGAAAKVYKRKIIEVNSLNFESKLTKSEDVCFFLEYLVHCQLGILLDKALYYYRVQMQGNTLTVLNGIQGIALACDYALEKTSQILSRNLILDRFLGTMVYVYSRPDFRQNAKSLEIIRQYFEMIEPEIGEKLRNYKRISQFLRNQNTIRAFLKRAIQYHTYKDSVILNLFNYQFTVKRPRTWLLKRKLQKKYSETLLRIKHNFKVHKKVKVAFLFSEFAKIKTQDLIKSMMADPAYEVLIVISPLTGRSYCSQKDELNKIAEYFGSWGLNVERAYDINTGTAKPLDSYSPDIIFYQQPWSIPSQHSIDVLCNVALPCYVPYFVPNFGNTRLDCQDFHKKLFRYYVLDDNYKEIYDQALFPFNEAIKTVGHPTLDSIFNCEFKLKNKIKTIIYAPHFSFCSTHSVGYSTFIWSGFYLLSFAKAHPEFNWIFKPHPRFARELLDRGLLTKEEVDDYFKQWQVIGTVCESPDYLKLFKQSDLLITDCGSFLVEYFMTGNPVIRLVSGVAKQPNYAMKKILSTYYEVLNQQELESCLDLLLSHNRDYKEATRTESVKAYRSQYRLSTSRIKLDLDNIIGK